MKKLITIALTIGILGLLGRMLDHKPAGPPEPTKKKVAVIKFMPLSTAHVK